HIRYGQAEDIGRVQVLPIGGGDLQIERTHLCIIGRAPEGGGRHIEVQPSRQHGIVGQARTERQDVVRILIGKRVGGYDETERRILLDGLIRKRRRKRRRVVRGKQINQIHGTAIGKGQRPNDERAILI